jgi:class 3 adenylate cyclase
LQKNKTSKKQCILLPTGDGMCIALFPSLFEASTGYDIHLNIALEILAGLESYNIFTNNNDRKFAIRVGLNENTDNIIIDVNGKQNVAGRGINMAQRTMSKADGNQILIGEATYQTLCEREKYVKAFRPYSAKTKHDEIFTVYQFISKNHKA